jgi:hypothetical protein
MRAKDTCETIGDNIEDEFIAGRGVCPSSAFRATHTDVHESSEVPERKRKQRERTATETIVRTDD